MQPKQILVVTFIIFIFLASTFQVNAQCSGIYFKPSKIQKIPSTSLVLNDDFNNDGKKDLATFFSNSLNSTINIQLKTADGFQDNPTATQFNAYSEYFQGLTGDVNGDGLKDIVLAYNTTPQSVVTFINNGSSGFTASQPTAVSSAYENLNSVIDLNGDGKDDLLTISVNYVLSYRLAQANNTFGSPVQLMTDVRNAFAGKFSGDNNNDIVVYIPVQGYGYAVMPLINQGGAVFSSSFANQVLGLQPQATGDFNNDGILDLVSPIDRNTVNTSVFEYQIYTSSSQGTLTKSTKVVNSEYVSGVPLIGDFNGDGLKDIAFQTYGNIFYYINNATGNGSVQKYRDHLRGGAITVTDFNGDGKDDLFGALGTNLFDRLHGTLRSIEFYENICNRFGQTEILDFNDDGSSDIAFWRPADGRWLAFNNTTQTFYWGISTNDIPVPNDYDGDGKTDLAVYRKSEGNWYILRSSDNAWMVFQFGTAEDKPVPSDFDNDGKADFVVYRPSNGGWYVFKSQTNSFLGVQFGIAEDKPVPMDFNGDNKADYAVYRPSTGVWYILHSSDYSFRAIQFGISTDTPVPADYDLDGKADIAVFRDGVWYILLSATNSVLYYQFGTTGDIPFVYGAYPSNIAVYRPSQSRLYNYLSNEPQIVPNVTTNDNFLTILPRY